MALTLHNATVRNGTASASSAVVLHTATAGSVLLVWTQTNEASSLSAVNINGTQLTRLAAVSAGTSRQELWGLTAPGSGVLTISAQAVGANVMRIAVIATTFVGQRQGITPFGGTNVGTVGAANNLAISVSATITNMVVAGFGFSNGAALILTTPATTIASATASTGGRLVVGYWPGAATVSASATAGASNQMGAIGIHLIAEPDIRFDNAAHTATNVAANSRGMLLTATPGAVLLVFVGIGDAVSVSAVNAGTAQLTRLSGINYSAGASGRRAELWGLTAPASGTLTISAVLVGVAAAQIAIGAVTYTGHRTTATPFGGVATGTASTGATNSLIISSTAGNLIVIGWNTASGLVSSMPGTVNRLMTQGDFPAITVADGHGATNYTASATRAAVTSWGNIGLNLIASSEPAAVNGSMSALDVVDTFVGTGKIIIRGSLAATDPASTFSASAKARVSGLFAATDTASTFSASAQTRVSSTFLATDPQDTFAATGTGFINGSVVATDAQDQFVASGSARIVGSFAATDATDLFVGTTAVRISGTFTATDASDTVAAAAAVIVSGSFTATDTPDTFVGIGTSGDAVRTGTVAATDAADQFVATSNVIVAGFSIITDAPDTFTSVANNVSASAVAVFIYPGAGSGHGGQASPDYWDAREAYLQSLQPDLEEPALIVAPPHSIEVPNTVPSPVNPRLLIDYRVERSRVISALPLANDIQTLIARGKRLQQVNQLIAQQLHRQALADAARAARAERRKARQVIRKKLTRKVVLLSALGIASRLTHVYYTTA